MTLKTSRRKGNTGGVMVQSDHTVVHQTRVEDCTMNKAVYKPSVPQKETLPRKLSCQWLYQGYSSFWAWINSIIKKKGVERCRGWVECKTTKMYSFSQKLDQTFFFLPHTFALTFILVCFGIRLIIWQRITSTAPGFTTRGNIEVRELKRLFFVHREQSTIATMSATIQVYTWKQCLNFTACIHIIPVS